MSETRGWALISPLTFICGEPGARVLAQCLTQEADRGSVHITCFSELRRFEKHTINDCIFGPGRKWYQNTFCQVNGARGGCMRKVQPFL